MRSQRQLPGLKFGRSGGIWQIEELWRWLAGQRVNFGTVDVLVNNAGIGGARLVLLHRAHHLSRSELSNVN